jgi:hypothetical protein
MDRHTKNIEGLMLPIKDLIEEITTLTDEWYLLIGKDHHKDKDCHWYVETRWSYSYPPIYTVLHHGYILDDIQEEYKTYEEALQGMKDLLICSIELEKTEQSKEELDW